MLCNCFGVFNFFLLLPFLLLLVFCFSNTSSHVSQVGLKLCICGWPWTPDPSASTSQGLGLQVRPSCLDYFSFLRTEMQHLESHQARSFPGSPWNRKYTGLMPSWMFRISFISLILRWNWSWIQHLMVWVTWIQPCHPSSINRQIER